MEKTDIKLPHFLLDGSRLLPGDVLLTRGTDTESKLISKGLFGISKGLFSGGRFSHAALLVSPSRIFESDGGIIGSKVLNLLGWATKDNRPVPLFEIPGGTPKEAAVYRHPDFHEVQGQFDKAYIEEMKDSFGRGYSQYFRVVRLAKLPGFLGMPAAWLTRLVERYGKRNAVPGVFCSELVARIYHRLDLDLFGGSRNPDQVTPNDLARSKLLKVPEAFVDTTTNRWLTETFYSAIGFSIFRQLLSTFEDLDAEKVRVRRGLDHNLGMTLRSLTSARKGGYTIQVEDISMQNFIERRALEDLKKENWALSRNEYLNQFIMFEFAEQLSSLQDEVNATEEYFASSRRSSPSKQFLISRSDELFHEVAFSLWPDLVEFLKQDQQDPGEVEKLTTRFRKFDQSRTRLYALLRAAYLKDTSARGFRWLAPFRRPFLRRERGRLLRDFRRHLRSDSYSLNLMLTERFMRPSYGSKADKGPSCR
jgi:hypothetical protein